jgi:hypothetical protein
MKEICAVWGLMAEGSEEESQGTGVVVMMLIMGGNQEKEEQEQEDLALSLAREDTHNTWRLCRCSSQRDRGSGASKQGKFIPTISSALRLHDGLACSRDEPRESFLSLAPCSASGSGTSLGRRHACSGSLALCCCFDNRWRNRRKRTPMQTTHTNPDDKATDSPTRTHI